MYHRDLGTKFAKDSCRCLRNLRVNSSETRCKQKHVVLSSSRPLVVYHKGPSDEVCRRTQKIAEDCRRLQKIAEDRRRSQKIAEDCRRLQKDCRRLQKIAEDCRKNAEDCRSQIDAKDSFRSPRNLRVNSSETRCNTKTLSFEQLSPLRTKFAKD